MASKQIFLNGNVITMNSKAPEATAFGVLGNRFGPVGSDDEIRIFRVHPPHTRECGRRDSGDAARGYLCGCGIPHNRVRATV